MDDQQLKPAAGLPDTAPKPAAVPNTNPLLRNTITPTAATDQAAAPVPPVLPPNGHKRRKPMIIVGIVILLIAALAGTYFLVNGSKKTPTASVTVVKKPIALLRIGVIEPFPANFYPDIENSNFSAELTNQMFEGLTKYQNENQVVPGLAESWTNPDNLTWVFKLVPNVKFHNGDTLTSAQVKASLEALEKNSFGQPYTSTIASVSAPTSSTVKITTNTPDPLLPNELTNLWIYDTGSATPNDPANGTGPYTLKPGTKLSSGSVQLVAFDGYRSGAPLAKELDFTYYADPDSEVKAIQQNQLDIADLDSQSLVGSVASYGYVAYANTNPQVNFLMPNTLKAGSPLQKLAVRQAIYEAFDPTALIKADGRAGVAATQLVPQEIPGYNPAIKRPALDPTKAKADLVAAGYPNGFTIGFTYFASRQALAVELQKEMAAIGVTLTLDPESSGAVLSQKTSTGQTDLYYFGFLSSLIDTSDVAQPLVIDTADYKNTKIDALYNQASTTFDTASRLKLLQQLNLDVMNDVAVMPVYTPVAEYFAVKSNLVIQDNNLSTYSGIDFNQVYAK